MTLTVLAAALVVLVCGGLAPTVESLTLKPSTTGGMVVFIQLEPNISTSDGVGNTTRGAGSGDDITTGHENNIAENNSTTVDENNNVVAENNSATVDENNNVIAEKINLRPIIGILAQELGRKMNRALTKAGKNYTSYIAASYVKSVESAGARVVPVLINQPEEYYRMLAASLNGILFPGGAVSITNSSGYGRGGDLLYQLVVSANSGGRPQPLWATCLGFEMLVYLAGGRANPLTGCKAQGRADPLHLQQDWQSSRLWGAATPALMKAVQTQNITSNFHKYCVSPETFANSSASTDYTILSTNLDDEGVEYVSTIEHNRFPIFATQWHPEKAPFEWKTGSIPHTAAAIELESHVMTVFVGEARRNFNSFSSVLEEEAHLIYNYSPTYIAQYYPSSFQQCYYF